MLESFLVTLREGIEAALLIGIILAYLARTGNQDKGRSVWAGVAGGILFSIGIGGAIIAIVGELDKNAERIFEGVATLLACGVLTWMILWMRRNAANLAGEIRDQVDVALAKNSNFALGFLALVAVGREGLETVLFLFAFSRDSGVSAALIGGGLGLGLAVVLGVLLYRGSRVLDLRSFFKFSGILLIFFGAGLLAYGVHELQDASVIPFLLEQKELWNINHILNDKKGVGVFLKALFGYNGNPSLIETVLYVTYLVGTLTLFLKPVGAHAKPASDTAN